MGEVRLLIAFACLWFSSLGLGQSTIAGTVFDQTKVTIISASVMLKDTSGRIVSYTFTDSNGKYELKADQPGIFILFANSLGFEHYSRTLNAKNGESSMIDIELATSPFELEGVVIKSVRPIRQDGDKIIYDAASFTQGNEQVVEDLIKKLPGINISSDGTIMMGTQEIEKVMINGDDMFGKGYKILTKNMPVNPIDKIELLQKYSNNKHLKGIENSNKVALNLTLKEDFKRRWFGNVQAGHNIGALGRYEARSNLMNFGNKSKYYFLTNLNNIGSDATGDINNLIRPNLRGEAATIGDNQSVYNLLQLKSDVPNLYPKRTNLNNAKMLSLNSIFTLSEKTKLKLLGFLNTDEVDAFVNRSQTFSANGTSFQNNENFIGRAKQITGFGQVDLTHDISSSKTLEYTGKLNKSNFENGNDLIFNKLPLTETLQTNNQLFDQKLVYSNRVTDDKALVLSFRYMNEKSPQNYAVNQFLFSDLFSGLFADAANNTSQFSENRMNFGGFETHFYDKKSNGDLLEVKFGNQFIMESLNSRLRLQDNDIVLQEPVNYQNGTNYTTNDLYLTSKYRKKINNVGIVSQFDAHQLFNRLENLEDDRSQNPFFINPKLALDWSPNEKHKFTSAYSYSTTNAKIIDIYSHFIQTGFRSLSKGNNDFNQLASSSAFLNYNYGKWTDRFFASTFINYIKSHDFFSTNSLISQNFALSEKIVTKDRNLLTASSTFDRFISPIRSNLKIALGATQINFKNIVNNSNLREVKNNAYNYGFELRSTFGGVFNYHIGSKWDYNEVKTIITNSFNNNMSFADLSLVLNNAISFKVQTERYFFGNLDVNANTYYFLDLEAKYIVKQNKLTFFITGNNLFNVDKFTNLSITDIAISKTEYRLQPRYLLFKTEYRF